MIKNKFKLLTLLLAFTLISYTFTSCSSDDAITETEDTSSDTEEDDSTNDSSSTDDDDDDTLDLSDWTTETHSNDVDPNFEAVFSDTEVKRIDIVISEDNWDVMIDDMIDLYGSFGSGKTSFSDDDDDPVFVPAEVFYEGIEWYKVGVRFKGNSSLASAWGSGVLKLSLKLDFDEFEDDYPDIKNQRFYGFKQLNLKNNYNDDSFLREKVAAEIFENAGLAVSNTSFYTVYIDYGGDPIYFGLYTMVEEVDDTLIETQFSSGDGNLYKPEGDGASFTYGSFDYDEFEKKTNESAGDWTDIKAVFSALHDSSRYSDSESWREGLEEVFDVDTFLNYLAVNTVIQNWDTYGRMTHNYYLYNNPDNSLLTWIPWDNNESLQEGKSEGALNLNFSDLDSYDWPLIEYLYDDDVYREIYDNYVQATIDGPFETTYIQNVYSTYSSLIQDYATSETNGYTFLDSDSDFYSAISTLKSHASSRSSAAENYLD